MKILCIGNNTEDTDKKSKFLSLKNKSTYHGLITAETNVHEEGFYSVSIYDISFEFIIPFVVQNFDKVFVLDQSKESYTHPDAFYLTIKAAQDISKHIEVEFLDKSAKTKINYFESYVNTNKSFCIFPFIELLVTNNHTTVCCRSSTPIVKLQNLDSFKTNKEYQLIRKDMLAGKLRPDHCQLCYDLEKNDILSARKQETVEWANRLNLVNIEDLETIENPAYYEVRANNTCNLLCRTCSPEYSSSITNEYKKIKLIPSDFTPVTYTNFDFINFSNLKKLYVAGGEPTIMIEFFEFLNKCKEQNNTKFELLINTNGTKFSNRFKNLISHFPNTGFIFSIDGYKDLNYYIRYPSEWNPILENIKWAKTNGYNVSFNVTVSIYNVAFLDELFLFLSNSFPGELIHCQPAHSKDDIFSAFNFPNGKKVLDSLFEIKKLNCYNSILLKSFIDGLVSYYQQEKDYDKQKLKKFFEFNDQIDNSRNVKLSNFIPELDKYRNEI